MVLFAAGKPRPGVVAQADEVTTPDEILICPLTSTLLDAPLYRPTVQPSAVNGLLGPSQLMADKVGPVPRARIGATIGHLNGPDLLSLNIALLTVLDLGGLRE